MRILGIETATTWGGVALVDGDTVVFASSFEAPNNHSTECADMVSQALRKASLGLGEIDAVAVSIGPGSFTGLRVGLSLAKGLCAASGLPVVPVPTLEAIACNLAGTQILICVLLRARKGYYYVGSYRPTDNGVEALGYIEVLSPEQIVERTGEPTLFTGEGVEGCRLILGRGLGHLARFADAPITRADAQRVAKLGAMRLAESAVHEVGSLEPLYLLDFEARKWVPRSKSRVSAA